MIGPVAAAAVLEHVPRDADLIGAMANGEPVGLIDALEADHERLEEVRIHQMHALHARPSIEGKCGDHLRHVSYFLSPVTRPSYWAGTCDLVPNHFSEMPHCCRRRPDARSCWRPRPRPTATATSASAPTPSTSRR